MKSLENMSCWVLTDGKAGTENQCIGLAEALGIDFEIKRIKTQAPWRWLPVDRWPFPFMALSKFGDLLHPPFPDLLIASGRHSVPFALAIKKSRGPRTLTVQIQNPRIAPSRFDLVVTPQHDRINGDNVISTLGALNRITRVKLDQAVEKFESRTASLPQPLISVLIGGSNKFYTLTPEIMRDLCNQLKALHNEIGCGFLITASRRTGDENLRALKDAVADLPAWHWDGTGDNPYFGFLALADAHIVTCDSVSMTSEAATTGKPVYVVRLDARPNKFETFHRSMEAANHTRPFSGKIEFGWQSDALRETERVASHLKDILT